MKEKSGAGILRSDEIRSDAFFEICTKIKQYRITCLVYVAGEYGSNEGLSVQVTEEEVKSVMLSFIQSIK